MPFFNLPSGGGGDGLPVLTGEAVPSDSVGSNGQLFIDTLAGRLYVKENGTWGAGIDVGGAADWEELTGKPAEFPPAAHGHAIADVAELQAALDSKQAAGSYASATHGHVAADITDLATSVVTSVNGQTGAVTITTDAPASSWEEIVNKPATFPPESHTHQVADVVNLQTILDGKADDSHSHAIADVSGLQAALDSKATPSDVTAAVAAVVNAAPESLDTLAELAQALDNDGNFAATVTNALAGKADASHSHAIADVEGLQSALNAAGGLNWSVVPSAPNDAADAGSIAYNSSFLFLATAANTWKRIPLNAWTVPPSAPTSLSATVADEPAWTIEGFALLDTHLNAGVANAESMQLSPDGLKAYYLDGSNVRRFDLSQQYNFSTAVQAPASLDISPYAEFPRGIAMSVDGSNLYALYNSKVVRFYLSSSWDIATATQTQLFSLAPVTVANSNYSFGIAISRSGSRLFHGDRVTGEIYAHYLDSPYSISSAAEQQEIRSASSHASEPLAISFDPTGSNLFVMGEKNGQTVICQYALSSAYHISDATFVRRIDLGPVGYSRAFAFSADGLRLYVARFGEPAIDVYGAN